MLSKKPVNPGFIAASMFFRKPTGSRLMSSMAAVALAMMLPSSSDGKFISSRISVTTTWMTTPTNSTSRASGSPNGATMRSNASIGTSRLSSVSVFQIPRNVPVIRSQEMLSRAIADSIVAAASPMTPDSASSSYIASPPGSSVMKPLMRFSAVRGTASPVNGFRSRITVSRWKPGTRCACSLAQPRSDFLTSSRTLSRIVEANAPTSCSRVKARSASDVRFSMRFGRFSGLIAAHASAKSAPVRLSRSVNTAHCWSSQSAVSCSVPRSFICASTSSRPASRRKSPRISTVGALTSSSRSGSWWNTFLARFQNGAISGRCSSGSATSATTSRTFSTTASMTSETNARTSATIAST